MSLYCPYLTSVTAVCTVKSTDQCVSVVSVSDQCNCCGTATSVSLLYPYLTSVTAVEQLSRLTSVSLLCPYLTSVSLLYPYLTSVNAVEQLSRLTSVSL